MKIKASSSINDSVDVMKSRIDTIEKSIKSIENYVNGASEVWQGADATSFVNKFNNEAIPELKKYVSVINKYIEFLGQVYPIFKSFDEFYDNPIN